LSCFWGESSYGVKKVSQTSKYPAIAKIIRPALTGILPRERLFKHLNSCRDKPVIWINGPPGSGKTTLIASYLDYKKIPCLWYQVDEGDADISTFFYYLGQAAKKTAPLKRKPLPLLTPEYMH
jgi:ATP/maltotriose-dependent transcriptional regulator MalT